MLHLYRWKYPLASSLLAMAGVQAAAAPAPPAGAAAKLLRADGRVLRDGNRNVVHLRGVNLGGWLEWQAWMCPIDSSKTAALRDLNPGHNGYNFDVRKLLTERFGPAVAANLVNAYLDSWITTRDLDNIKALGLNVVRLTFGYDTLLNNDGTWRPDAFERMDWLVANAWERGIYTILDYHAFLPPGADQDGSATGYWSNEAQKAETVAIWRRVAEHYGGNPAIALYDLLNEPNNSHPKGREAPKSAVVCELYDRLYQAIRSVDPDHAIAMEGTWGWDTLRDPRQAGYRNVVYSLHWYYWWTKTPEERRAATERDVASFAERYRDWNVPCFIGEFNLFGDEQAWAHAIEQYDRNGLSWTIWTYKNTASGTNSWGVYTTIPGKAPPVPNLVTDSAEEIRAKWRAWATRPETFSLNPLYQPILLPAGA